MAALADFIGESRRPIVDAWEEFARTFAPTASVFFLRDHIDEILDAIIADMRTSQSPSERDAKSKGHGEVGPLARVGQTHASTRLESGFRLDQLMAEYRALRTSVLSLWEKHPGSHDPGGVARFNEAIDEALNEAVTLYVAETGRYRDQSLGILGHDLRNPLGAIIMGAAALLDSETLDDRSARMAGRMLTSAKRMDRMIADLLDLTRTRLGDGIPIRSAPMDMDLVCRQVVAELEAVHANRLLRYTSEGDLRGEWDFDRMSQVLSNLLGNALEHGAPDEPVDLVARGQVDEVILEVHNGGPPIPSDALHTLFEPMVRSPSDSKKKRAGLGLGLYIACHIVMAHAGNLQVHSTEADGTRFTARLPRARNTVRKRA